MSYLQLSKDWPAAYLNSPIGRSHHSIAIGGQTNFNSYTEGTKKYLPLTLLDLARKEKVKGGGVNHRALTNDRFQQVQEQIL